MNKQTKNPISIILPICSFLLLLFLSSSAYCAEVTLSWEAPNDNRVVGYNIYYGASDPEFKSSSKITIDSPDQTSCVIAGLQEGETYYFAATSFDAEGNESAFSDTVTYTVPGSTDPGDDVDDDGDGYTENEGDCDDTDSTIFPGAIEICGDGIDQDCNGSDLSCTDETEETEETINTDTDSDGISDTIEQYAPNNGDGNEDGIPDAEQAHVASFQDSRSTQFITLESPEDTTLENCRTISPLPENRPTEGVFEWGLFEFTINGIQKGGSTWLTVYLHEGPPPTEYKKYGPTPDNTADHWYSFNDDGQTGAVINENTLTLYFVDAARGDDNLIPDGKIIDEGGPLYNAALSSPDDTQSDNTSEPSDGGSSSGGGCFIITLNPFNE